MSSHKWLIKNGKFAVSDPEWRIVSGYMLIEDDRISYIGEDLPEGTEGLPVHDGKHQLFIPGLINTHGHAAMSLLRGYGDDLALQVWLQEKCGRWRKSSQLRMSTGGPRYLFWKC